MTASRDSSSDMPVATLADFLQPPWETLADRLRWRIGQQQHRGRQRGLRLFQRRMEARAAELRAAGKPAPDGTSLSSIQTYLNGEVVPSLRFLLEAAHVFQVRPAWLITGDGLPTQSEHDAAVQMRQIGEEAAEHHDAWRKETVGDLFPGFWELPDAARGSVLAGFQKYTSMHFPASETTLEELGVMGTDDKLAKLRFGQLTIKEAEACMATWFSDYLSAPFRILHIDRDALGPVEHGMVIDALMHVIDVVRWAELSGGADA